MVGIPSNSSSLSKNEIGPLPKTFLRIVLDGDTGGGRPLGGISDTGRWTFQDNDERICGDGQVLSANPQS